MWQIEEVKEREESATDRIFRAVKFLSHPRVVSAPLEKRVAFLSDNGFSAAEVEDALVIAGEIGEDERGFLTDQRGAAPASPRLAALARAADGSAGGGGVMASAEACSVGPMCGLGLCVSAPEAFGGSPVDDDEDDAESARLAGVLAATERRVGARASRAPDVRVEYGPGPTGLCIEASADGLRVGRDSQLGRSPGVRLGDLVVELQGVGFGPELQLAEFARRAEAIPRPLTMGFARDKPDKRAARAGDGACAVS